MTSPIQDEEKRPPPEAAGNGGDATISIDESDERPQSGENEKKDAKVEKGENEEKGGGAFAAYRVRQASYFL